MCPKKFYTSKKTGCSTHSVQRATNVSSIRMHDVPTYKENGAGCYISFNAYDPALGKMRHKTIKCNRIKGVNNRRTYAREVIKRLTEQLNRGWNPWIARDESNLVIFEDALQRYELHLEKMITSGYFRKETYDGYKSNIKIMREFIKKRYPLYYVYQFDRTFCVDFLDYVFIDRNNGAQTRNNYLNFLRVLSGFLVEKGYLPSKPTEGIAPISKRLYKKERECIPLAVVNKIAGYCRERDPHFLFACYLLYYCFIRPVEMTRLRVIDFNLKDSTVTIPGNASKNKLTQTVTIPKKVLQYGIELGIFSAAREDFIFSLNLCPGKVQIDPKHFRDHWEKVRRALKLKREWKFYSLKDTGITEMCDNNMASIAVRDQARHSSLAITDIYTRHKTSANHDIVELDGAL